MSTPPKRLLEDPLVEDAVRGHFAEAVDQSPVIYDVEAGLARHQAAVAAGAPLPAWAEGGAPAGVATATKLVVIGLVVATAAVGAAVALWPEAPVVPDPVAAAVPEPSDVPRVPPPESAVSAAVALPGTQPSEQAARDDVAADPEPVPAKQRRARQKHSKDTTDAGSDDSVQREIAEMGRARALLSANPAAALRILDGIKKEFPNGFLREEREALTILALAKVGDKDRARKEGSSFLSRRPTSSFAGRVRKAIATED